MLPIKVHNKQSLNCHSNYTSYVPGSYYTLFIEIIFDSILQNSSGNKNKFK